MLVFLKVGSFVSFIHLLPLQAKLLETISGFSYEAASSKRFHTNPKLPAPHRATSSIESIEYSTPQSKLQPRFSKSGMALSESGSDSTMFYLRLVPTTRPPS